MATKIETYPEHVWPVIDTRQSNIMNFEVIQANFIDKFSDHGNILHLFTAIFNNRSSFLPRERLLKTVFKKSLFFSTVKSYQIKRKYIGPAYQLQYRSNLQLYYLQI